MLESNSLQTRSAYRQIRRQLLHSQLPEGSRLVEKKWSTSLGLNRSAIREALSLLAHEGLLESGQRGGFFVPLLTRDVMDDTLEVRLALELGAVDILEIRGKVPEEGLQQLRQTLDMMHRLMESGFEYGFIESDRRFHEILVEMSGNPGLLRIYRQAPLPLSVMPEPDEAARRANMEGTYSDHCELCRLLEEFQLNEFRRLMRQHLLKDHHRHRAARRNGQAGSRPDLRESPSAPLKV